MKILLVDDSRTIRNIQKNTLASMDYTDILEAADGVEALAILKEQRPDLMLVDWNMPNMDGITLIRKVRETDKTLPMIMVTTEAEKSRRPADGPDIPLWFCAASLAVYTGMFWLWWDRMFRMP